MSYVTSQLNKIIRFFWGQMSPDELKRFALLSITFFLLIGTYWYIRSMKDGVFSVLVGYRYQPLAKLISLACIICVVLFYNKLLDLLKKDKLFYLISFVFGSGFLGIGYLLWIYACTPTSCHYSPAYEKFLGFFIYCFIESFGSIMPALFLSIVVSTMSTESAKKGYGMIYTFGQLGLIVAAWFLANFVSLGFGILFGIGGILISMLPLLLSWYVRHSPITEADKIEAREHKEKTGVLEGLKLILSRPYVAGLLVITTMYEVIGTIVEYQMGFVAINEIYPVKLDGGAAFTWFKSMQTLSLGIVSLSFALLGTSFFMRKFGLKFCIISFPALIGVAITTLFGLYMFGVNHYILMWAFFVAVILFKALSYTLNNPAREVLYIPTSKDVKFKAKSWIEAFGNRTTKGLGATVTGTLGATLPPLLIFGTFLSLGIVGFWIFVAANMGNTFNKLQKEHKIIE